MLFVPYSAPARLRPGSDAGPRLSQDPRAQTQSHGSTEPAGGAQRSLIEKPANHLISFIMERIRRLAGETKGVDSLKKGPVLATDRKPDQRNL